MFLAYLNALAREETEKNIHERVSTFQIRVPVKSKRNETESNQTKSKIKPNQRKETKHRNERRPKLNFVDFSGIYISSIFSFMPDFSILYI